MTIQSNVSVKSSKSNLLLTIVGPSRSHAKFFECSVVDLTGSAKVVDKVIVE